MTFPVVTALDWRAQVDKDLAGASFDKTLVFKTPEGLSVQSLYTEVPAGAVVASGPRGSGFRICMRHEAGATREALGEDVEGGADSLWVRVKTEADLDAVLASIDPKRTSLVLETEGAPSAATLDRLAPHLELSFAFLYDGLADFAGVARVAAVADERAHLGAAATVSTLRYHDAGADAADELAFALSTGAAYIEAMLGAGLTAAAAARRIAVQVAVGRDTFVELAKLRALRVVWQKLLAAAGAPDAPRTVVHAVCSSRTLTQRDPWVNMLRVTTQVFAGVLGGADLVTPASFDAALGTPEALGRRIARNTGLVLREESHLGKVLDPAGGSYYLETLTDALAREAWRRFQELEKEGGIAAALASGDLQARLEAAWQQRLELVAKRKTPVLGVSDFANLGEKLPHAPHPSPAAGALPVHHDAEPFERLRDRATSKGGAPEAVLVTLGTLAESRPRAGFAAGFFTAGGIRTRESTSDEKAAIACLCGTDERYATEAVARARALKAAGCGRVLVAGKPGALEPELREAGVDGFIFVGCDVVATLSELLESLT